MWYALGSLVGAALLAGAAIAWRLRARHEVRVPSIGLTAREVRGWTLRRGLSWGSRVPDAMWTCTDPPASLGVFAGREGATAEQVAASMRARLGHTHIPLEEASIGGQRALRWDVVETRRDGLRVREDRWVVQRGDRVALFALLSEEEAALTTEERITVLAGAEWFGEHAPYR